MSVYIQNFLKFRPLLSELVSRDIKIKYRRSVLGVLWTLLNPLFMMIILSVVFSNIFKFDIENFPLYVLSGQVIFNFFSESTTSAMSSIVSNAPLIKKVYIPKYLFVLSRTVSSFINLCASFSALLMVMVVMRIELKYTIVLAILPLSILMVFSLGVGMFLAAVTVRFRDIMHLYSVFTTGLMYLTPVIYPMSQLPGKIKTIVELNPLTNILVMFRGIVLDGILPSASSILLGVVEALIAFAIGVYVFYKNQDEFILNI
ncbi:MAG: ABC transporter permease [Suipraeoptans sp.]